jgi:2-C-methyl-D-erythritol 4-phosphate cytidylyltransferase
MRRVSAVIVAAGKGKRFGSAKQFTLLHGKPLLEWSLEKFEGHPDVDEIVLVLPDEKKKAAYLGRGRKVIAVVVGGPRRQDSVCRGVEALDPDQAGIVLVHDGARPLVSRALISRVIEETQRKGAAIPVVPVEETVKEVDKARVVRTLDRERLYRVQTPQGFLYPVLKKALERAREEGYWGTDEAMLLERTGETVAVVPGDPRNIKITTPLDLKVAEVWLES